MEGCPAPRLDGAGVSKICLSPSQVAHGLLAQAQPATQFQLCEGSSACSKLRASREALSHGLLATWQAACAQQANATHPTSQS